MEVPRLVHLVLQVPSLLTLLVVVGRKPPDGLYHLRHHLWWVAVVVGVWSRLLTCQLLRNHQSRGLQAEREESGCGVPPCPGG